MQQDAQVSNTRNNTNTRYDMSTMQAYAAVYLEFLLQTRLQLRQTDLPVGIDIELVERALGRVGHLLGLVCLKRRCLGSELGRHFLQTLDLAVLGIVIFGVVKSRR